MKQEIKIIDLTVSENLTNHINQQKKAMVGFHKHFMIPKKLFGKNFKN